MFLSHAVQAARGRQPPFGLCYHGIGDVDVAGDPHGLMIPLARFEEHLDVIAARGYRLVGVSEQWDAVLAGTAQGAGALSFDDGLAETMATAAAVLTARGLTATAFIPTGLMGKPHPDLAGGQRIVGRSQVLELAAAGLEIGSHSIHHRDLATLRPAEALEELRRSRADLEDLLGTPVRSLAYPFGSFDVHTMQAAREAGYSVACGATGIAPWRPYAVPREVVYPTATPLRLRLKMAGLYGPADAAARLRNRLRARRGFS